MDPKLILATIAGMALVTYLPRMLPALALSSRRLNPWLERWLAHVPAAVLSALLVPSLLAPEGTLQLSWNNLFLWTALPCFLVALKTRSFFGVVALGLGLVAGVRFFL